VLGAGKRNLTEKGGFMTIHIPQGLGSGVDAKKKKNSIKTDSERR
jgi:hypothetical protein